KAFRKISTEDQAVVKRIMAEAFASMDAQNEKDEAGARDALAQNGIEFVELSEEDKQAWEELATGVVDELASKEIYPVEVFKRLQQRLEEMRQEP
ncbi:MAG: C4-dicarboxylate ABC transporter, partial [Thalassolituus maritimus]